MAKASKKAPDAYTKINELFGQFGYFDVTPAVPVLYMGRVPAYLVEWTITICLQPSPVPTAGEPEVSIRQAMYEIAEDAIAIAEQEFILTEGPEITISGGVNKYIDGKLRLQFRERSENPVFRCHGCGDIVTDPLDAAAHKQLHGLVTQESA